ncbi:MAG TPA: DUF5659 domain-containing protein [Caldisericia bacterium]|nr:DUF5659 domain-containing protein [Caldisericia bacterium]
MNRLNPRLYITKSEDDKYLLISDLYIATFLITSGISCAGIKRSATNNEKAYFLFEIDKLKDVINGVKSFLSGLGRVPANSYSAELKKQKSLVRGIIESFDKTDVIKEGKKLMITDKEIYEVE